VKPAIHVRQISAARELAAALRIRTRVFVREQGVPQQIELDNEDARAVHLIALGGQRAVGTARLVLHHGSAKIGRMAVLKTYRRQGIGTKLLERAIATALRLGAQRIYLHAQVPAITFYGRLGFRCAGPVFEEAGIPHRKMVLRVPSVITRM
jgi:predicted GNAT family N-acyltransferase